MGDGMGNDNFNKTISIFQSQQLRSLLKLTVFFITIGQILVWVPPRLVLSGNASFRDVLFFNKQKKEDKAKCLLVASRQDKTGVPWLYKYCTSTRMTERIIEAITRDYLRHGLQR